MSQHIRHTEIMKLLKEHDKQNYIIHVPLMFVKLTGDYGSAALLNRVLYWTERSKDPEGWFYRTYAEWEEELGLSKYQIKRAIRGDKRIKSNAVTLSSLGVEMSDDVKIKGSNSKRYRVNKTFVNSLNNFISNVNNVTPQGSTMLPPNVNNVTSQHKQCNPRCLQCNPRCEHCKPSQAQNVEQQTITNTNNHINNKELSSSHDEDSPRGETEKILDSADKQITEDSLSVPDPVVALSKQKDQSPESQNISLESEKPATVDESEFDSKSDSESQKDSNESDSQIPAAPIFAWDENGKPLVFEQIDKIFASKTALMRAISFTFGIDENYKGMAGILLAQLNGSAKKKGQRKEFSFAENPVSAIEVAGLGVWYLSRYERSKPPTTAETLYERILEFRDSGPAYGIACNQGRYRLMRAYNMSMVPPRPEVNEPTPEARERCAAVVDGIIKEALAVMAERDARIAERHRKRTGNDNQAAPGVRI